MLAAVVLVVTAYVILGGCEQLLFADEFDSLDEARWGHMVSAWGGGNREFQYYRNSRNNSYVRDGILYLVPTLTADEFGEDFLYHGNLSYPDCNHEPCASVAGGSEIVQPVLSARISTWGKFSFRYGRMEVRARLPKGDWIWPAIWLMPQNEDTYGGWPRGGEIDLMESRGNEHLVDGGGEDAGVRHVGSTVHFGPKHPAMAHYKKIADKSLADDFHVYTLDWSEKGFRFLLDGQLIGERPAPEGGFWKLGGFQGEDIWGGRPMAPFDQEFFVILNVAVGGNFFHDGLHNSPHPRPYDMPSGHPMRQFWEKRGWWRDTWRGERTALQVDFVRVYKA